MPGLRTDAQPGSDARLDVHCHRVSIYLLAGALRARALGVDVIICDHHLPPDTDVPGDATAVLCPPQADCNYPNPALAACGVSLKLAQAGNPERRAPWFPGRSFMNYNTRSTFRRGLAYAERMEAAAPGTEAQGVRDLQFDVFRELSAGRTQVSTHTQIYQVVAMTMSMAEDFGIPFFIDHGTFDGWRAAPEAERIGVPAILGPRQITLGIRAPGFAEYDQDGAIFGVAAKYQDEGHTNVGFNTDCVGTRGRGGPSQEELGLQAAMGVRYGFDNSDMQAVRGVTSVPAATAGLDSLGTIEAGKDADIICVTGDPLDPRCSVEVVWSKGIKVYDTSVDRRRF